MQIVPLPPVSLRDLAEANLQSVHRSAGCHVTQVIDAIMRAYGGRSRPADFTRLDSENWQEAGFVWEDILSSALAARARTGTDDSGIVRFRPGELTKDGIIGSPDGIAITPDGESWLEEYKCTWKGASGFDLYDKRYLPWLLQQQAYCHLADQRTSHLYVLHINGDYKGYIPQVRAWQLDFTDREIAETWAGMVARARKEGWIA